MTRFSICDKKYKLPHVKTLREYDEKFPQDSSPEVFRSRISSCPAVVLPSYIISSWEDPLPRVREESTTEVHAEDRTFQPVRRHSWSLGVKSDPIINKTFLIQRKASVDSRRSSVASIPEPIEECSSDEEVDENPFAEFDYMQCINCYRSGSTTSLESSTSDSSTTRQNISDSLTRQNINYCYKCKHLLKKQQSPIVTAHEGRRASWSGESFSNSPRRSRRSSLTDAIDLPIISEPTVDDETNDTAEMQMSVEREVDKLIKFNRTTEF